MRVRIENKVHNIINIYISYIEKEEHVKRENKQNCSILDLVRSDIFDRLYYQTSICNIEKWRGYSLLFF